MLPAPRPNSEEAEVQDQSGLLPTGKRVSVSMLQLSMGVSVSKLQ